MPNPHDKLIAAAAKEILGPTGFNRKGRSRIWIKDHGWWLSVVEFQPSSWAKGSHLNVAAHWLWIEQDHLSFDHGGRVEPFVEYTSDAQFQFEATRFAEAAAEKSVELERTFNSIEAAAAVLAVKERELPEQARGSWSAYHAGMAAGLSGGTADAAGLFNSIRDARVRLAVARVNNSLADPDEFRRTTDVLIAEHRKALGFEPVSSMSAIA
ncbi:hypothetical protein [Sphingomonas psychrotolerans]|uniref:hypothetical protein n=1 Tax=Sphingomonas psychrotolerans TaxID=1327635 RepID=UPI0018F6A336|nr:hypothetical protein [Sphingomonas psychrotolerans]